MDLISAARSDSFKRLTQLLDEGADPNQANEIGETPLVLATQRGCEKAVEKLLLAGANPLLAGGDRTLKYPPVAWAFLQNNIKIMQMLFDAIKDDTTGWRACAPGGRGYPSFSDEALLTMKNRSYPPVLSDKVPPLIEAIYQNDFVSFSNLLTDGANPHETLQNGLSSLHETIRLHRHEMFDLLLQNQVNINQSKPFSPLFVAVKSENKYAYSKLIALGAKDVPTSEYHSALMAAVYLNDMPVIKELIGLGSPIEQYFTDPYFTLVYVAAHYGYAEVLDYLLSLGLHPDLLPKGRSNTNFAMLLGAPTPLTPLSAAVKNGDVQIVRRLLQAGADPNRAPEGIPPLFFAMPRYRFDESETRDFKAIVRDYCTIIGLLKEAGADVNAPLSQAIQYDQEEIAIHLIKAGAKTDHPKFKKYQAEKLCASQIQEKFIKTFLDPILKALGYQNHEETWWREKGDVVQVFHLQNYPWNTAKVIDFSFYLGAAAFRRKKYNYFDIANPKPVEAFVSLEKHPYKSNLGYTITEQANYDEFIHAMQTDFDRLKEVL